MKGNKQMKKILATFLVTTLVLSNLSTTFAFDRNYEYLSDSTIFSETVSNTYLGKSEGNAKIENLNFDDIQNSIYAEEIVRMGAYDVIKGSANSFRPSDLVSNEETLAFLVRMTGREREALDTAATIRSDDSSLANLWSLGYLNVAMQMGLIDQRAYNQALATDQASLDPETSFLRRDPTTREELAVYIYDMLMLNDPELFPLNETVQYVYAYSDYADISVENIQKVDAIAASNIMSGKADGTFQPNGTVTREEMARTLANIDQYYYDQVGYEERRGTVGGISIIKDENNAINDRILVVYVRDSYGIVNILTNYLNEDVTRQTKGLNAPVYKDGKVYGLGTLSPDDEIEYVVNNETGEVIYVEIISSNTEATKVEGKILNVDFANKTLTIVDENETRHTYPVATSNMGDDYLVMDRKQYKIGEIPTGSNVELELINDVVTFISYKGEDVIINEFSGVVLENNPQLGYMIVVDSTGNRYNMKYYSNDIVVEKQQYYDIDNEIGYIDEVFPNFQYDPMDTTIDQIEAGDIVYIRPNAEDASIIDSISATTNYTMKYGRINQIIPQENTTNITVEFENGSTSYYEVPINAPVTKDGKFLNVNDIMVGDYAKFLVNQAIISPGYIEESVKEVVVEGSANYVNSILKGNVIGYDAIQNKLLVDNTRVLTSGDWSNYNGIESFEINKNIEIYANGQRTSIDYLNRYLREGTAYVAIQNSYSGDQIKKVSVYSGRDELLDRDTVVESTVSGDFTLLNGFKQITSDDGTIVVRHGRLVDNNNIQPYDYATVALNGGMSAAVVEVVDKPNDGGKMIARGRILSVDEGDNFVVKSMVVLEDTEWIYTPVEREFSIDNKTTFLIDGQVMPYDEFIGYTTTTQIDEVYNIVSDGTYAEIVSDSAYAKSAIRGTVYQTNDGQIYLKDVLYKDEETTNWETISEVDNTAVVSVDFNSIITRNGTVVEPTDLAVGEQVLVMTTTLPDTMTSGMTIDGVILNVEKY